jgi:PERQ amino acid-rich with GYF domain-containing protein
MMLGLGVGWQEGETQEPQMTLLPVAKAQKQRSQAVSVPVVASSPSPAPKPAWGSAQGQTPKKSMSEIQQEEARQVALQAMERKAAGRSSSGGWANVAASRGGSAGWQGGAALTAPAPTVPASSNVHSLRPHGGNKPSPAPRQVSAPSAMQQQQRRTSQEEQRADDFGASMSPALESWCKTQMSKINGSDDLTLVSFCMTLTDPSEIRQYLTAYLGSSSQVNSFASEFINKRGLGKTLQEEWEDMKPKKTRKKGGK